MSECRYLTGTNIAPSCAAEAKALIGKRVQYLRYRDIDRSGRGYFFPQIGTVTKTIRKQCEFNNCGDFVDVIEMVELTAP